MYVRVCVCVRDKYQREGVNIVCVQKSISPALHYEYLIANVNLPCWHSSRILFFAIVESLTWGLFALYAKVVPNNLL